MTVFRLAAVVTLFACSGSSPQVSTGPVEAKCPPVAATTPDCDRDCPSLQPMPSPSTAEPRYVVPGASGFWCAEFRRAAGDRVYLGSCYREESTCQTLRQRAVKGGQVVSSCQARDAAHCFAIVDTAGQKVHWRCYDSTERCAREQPKFGKQNPTMKLTTCERSASVGGNVGATRLVYRGPR